MSAYSEENVVAEAEKEVPGAPFIGSNSARRRGTMLRGQGFTVLVFLLLLAIWEIVSQLRWQPAYLLPAPSAVAQDLWSHRDGYWKDSLATLGEFFLGSAVGAVIGVIVGIILALSARLRRVLYPLLVGSQSLPTLALAPLLVLWFGYGILPKVIIVVQVVFFPIALATVAGLTAVSSEALLFGRSLGASRVDLFTKVRVPASLPYIFNGLKVSASYAAIAAVISEWAGATEGLGALMIRANMTLQTTTVFGSLVIITAIGVGSFAVVSAIERLVVPWHEPYRK